MNQTALKSIGSFLLILSAIVTMTAMDKAAAGNFQPGMILFIFWTISPYICIFVASLLLMRFTSIAQMSLIFCIISVLMFAFTLLTYIGTLGDKSSTYGLIFIFAPFYLHIGWFFLLAGGLFWRWLMSDKNSRG